MRLPRANVGTQRLLAAAEAMAGAAVKYKQVFLDEQLPQDFIEQLLAAADAVRKAAVEREFGRLKHEYALTPLRVRSIERVELHVDLVMLARLSQALSRARSPSTKGSLQGSAASGQFNCRCGRLARLQ